MIIWFKENNTYEIYDENCKDLKIDVVNLLKEYAEKWAENEYNAADTVELLQLINDIIFYHGDNKGLLERIKQALAFIDIDNDHHLARITDI